MPTLPTPPAKLLKEEPSLYDWAILHGYRGSLAHGTYIDPDDPLGIDDIDTMAIVVPPLDFYLGLHEYGSRGTREFVKGEWDIVCYEARKAIGLLRKGNPNVLSLLWLPDEMILHATASGHLLRASRDLFAARHVYHSYVGYARGQLAKMTRGEYRGFMGEKRKALVEEFGYDTKNASHLIRLLRQGIEFLRDGEMQVLRPDARELVDIKTGEWTLDKVKAEAELLFVAAQDAYLTSPLPQQPDLHRINALCVEVVRTARYNDFVDDRR